MNLHQRPKVSQPGKADEHDPIVEPRNPDQGQEIVNILMNLDPRTKKKVLSSLGASERVIKRKRRQDNRKVLETVRGLGEAIHPQAETIIRYPKMNGGQFAVDESGEKIWESLVFEGFVPQPPEPVVEKGRDAIVQWAEKWYDGEVVSAGSMDFDDEYNSVEEMADAATLQLISG